MINEPPKPTSIDNHLTTASPLPVIFWPDARLNKVCEDVTEEQFDNIKGLVASMIVTMWAENGIGLAAPQVGLALNVITIDIPRQQSITGAEGPFVMINPKIIGVDETPFIWEEGCLSVPGYFENRKRPSKIVVDYFNDDMQKHKVEFSGLHAFAIQHEMDHLVGKIFVDPLSALKQNRIKKKIQKTLNRR